MEIFVATLVLFGAVVAAMSIGVAVSGRSLRGSCGGTGADCSCDDATRDSCSLYREFRKRGGAGDGAT